jgi:chaperonin GroES
MKFHPLQDSVLIRRIAQEEKTTGGTIIPDTAQKKADGGRGRRGRDGRPLGGWQDSTAGRQGRRPGVVRQWSGTEIKLDGEELMIRKEPDLMGIIEGNAGAKRKAA